MVREWDLALPAELGPEGWQERRTLRCRRSTFYRIVPRRLREAGEVAHPRVAAAAAALAMWPDARSLAGMEIGALAAHVEEAQRLCETLDALGALDALADRRRDLSPEAEVNDPPHRQENNQETLSVICNAGMDEARTGEPTHGDPLPMGPDGAERCEDHEDAAARAARKARFLRMLTAERLCSLASHDMQALVRDSQRGSAILREVHLIDAATRILPVLGIDHDAWQKAIETMGPQSATIAVLLLDANRDHPRTPVRNPGGALRAMTLRHRRGTLNLVGSLMGLARRRAA